MTGAGRPIRFLLAVLASWTGARAALLWPGAPLALPAEASTGTGAAPVARFALPQPGSPARRSAARPPGFAPAAARARDAGSSRAASPATPAFTPSLLLPHLPGQAAGVPTPAAPEPALALLTRPPPPRRWSVSAWAVARGGSMAGDGPFGPAQLGGSQAGARLRYALTRSISLSGRLSTPLRGIGREAGLGVEWQPLKLPVPVSILLERRVALDSGPDGTALGAIAGVPPTRLFGKIELEAYGQAGVVARARREPYADGAVRLLQPVAEARIGRLAVGAGAWGGAQRGASRLDVGPALVATVPTGGPTLRVGAEWRQRIAGNAAPGSGPALTLGADF